MSTVFLLLTEFLVILIVCGKQGFGPGEQDWGFIDIFEGAHMFYWLFYTRAAVKNYTERPLVLWLQGGPSATGSGHANFRYLGPLDMDEKERKYAWANYVNVLLIDSPLGAGYSYVDDIKLLSATNTEIAKNLVLTMKGFYKNHPEFLDVPLYVFVESYAGKMGIEFVLEMWKARRNNSKELGELKSFNMGNPWISVEDQNIAMTNTIYERGMADRGQQKFMENTLNSVMDRMHQGYLENASWSLLQMEGEFCKYSYGIKLYNDLEPVTRSDSGAVCGVILDKNEKKLLWRMNLQVKLALQIPFFVFWGAQRELLVKAMIKDILKPAIHTVEKVLNDTDIRVRVLSGNLDLLCSTSASLRWIKKLNWPGKSDYLNATRSPYYVNDILEGFEKTGGGFSMIWLLRAGHLFIIDDPSTSAYIMKNITGVLGKKGFGPGEQDWGFADVKEGAHLFYWLYYANEEIVGDYKSRPLIVWLQGGPGVPGSYFANLNFIGPLDTDLKYRNATWTQYVNILFVDNPVGVGYSYVDSLFDYAGSNYEIASSLVELMKIFYERYPEFRGLPLHVFGESYGGKFAVEFALELYKEHVNANIKSRVESVTIINPWISPEDILSEIPNAAYYLGIVEQKDIPIMKERLIRTNELLEKNLYWWALLYTTIVIRQVHCDIIQGTSIFNVDSKVKEEETAGCGLSFLNSDFAEKLMNGPVSEALNLTEYEWTPYFKGIFGLFDSIYRPAVQVVNELLNSTTVHVSVCSGSHDLLVPTAGTLKWIEKLEWNSKDDYYNAPRKGFFVDGILEGFEKVSQGLSMYWIFRSGHMVAKDNLGALTYAMRKTTHLDD